MRLGIECGQTARFADTNARDLLATNYPEARRHF
jgi:hypothetical protein